jgi:flavin-dependent dehydrogenase
MTTGWDVIVVGARVAGAATALLLARAGLRVLCLDRARYGSDTLSTHALMRGGVLQLRRWGLLDAIIAAGTPAVRRTVFHYGDDAVSVTIRPASGVDALYAPRRTVIDAVIADAAAESGAVVRYGSTVTGLLHEDGDRVTGVVVRDRNGSDRTERATMVVGADGRNSQVAEAVGAPIQTAGRGSSAFVYGYWAGLPADGYQWLYRPGVSAGVIPTNDGLTCVFVGAPPARAAGLVNAGGVEHAFARLATDSAVDVRLRDGHRIGNLRYMRGMPSRLRRSWGRGWALVGDAGCWKDPLSTHGMTEALRDAELLAHAVLTAVEPGTGQLRALAGYQSLRDRLATPILQTSDRIAAYDWDLAELRRLLMTLSSAMADEVDVIDSLPAAPWLADAGRTGIAVREW